MCQNLTVVTDHRPSLDEQNRDLAPAIGPVVGVSAPKGPPRERASPEKAGPENRPALKRPALKKASPEMASPDMARISAID